VPELPGSGRFESGRPAGDRIGQELVALREAAEAAFTPPPVELFRTAARRQTRRRTGIVAVVLTALAGLGGGALAVADRGPDNTPRPAPTAIASSPSAPSPSVETTPSATAPASTATTSTTREGTAIIDALFLQPGDVGSGYRVVSGGQGSGDWTFEFTSSVLGCQPPGPNSPDSIARRDRTLSRGTPPPEDILTQYVANYRPGDAGRYLDEIRARVNACRPGNGRSITLGAQHFAGQDALLIEVNYGDGFTTKHVLVRQGDLLTEFFTKPERSTAAAQDLARTAALRLCRSTPVC
jgi:hypothetical protein